MTYLYKVFGLILASEIYLPELKPQQSDTIPATTIGGESLTGVSTPVTIRLGHTPDSLIDPRVAGITYQAKPGSVLINIPTIARYLITDGQEIKITPHSGANEADFRHFLFGSPLIAVLQQRGCLPLHGGAIVHRGGVCALLGNSKSGKSTLTAAFAQRGYSVMTDELTAIWKHIDGILWVEPGRPDVHLWAHTLEELQAEADRIHSIHEKIPKVAFALDHVLSQAAFPLENVIVLEQTTTTQPLLTKLKGHEGFSKVNSHASFIRLIEGMNRVKEHFELVTQLVSQTRLFHLQYPSIGVSPFGLVELIEQELAKPANKPT